MVYDFIIHEWNNVSPLYIKNIINKCHFIDIFDDDDGEHTFIYDSNDMVNVYHV